MKMKLIKVIKKDDINYYKYAHEKTNKFFESLNDAMTYSKLAWQGMKGIKLEKEEKKELFRLLHAAEYIIPELSNKVTEMIKIVENAK